MARLKKGAQKQAGECKIREAFCVSAGNIQLEKCQPSNLLLLLGSENKFQVTSGLNYCILNCKITYLLDSKMTSNAVAY